MKILCKFDNLLYPDRLAFWAFMVSGAFIILIYAPLFPRYQFSLSTIVFIYLLPWILIWAIYSFDVIKNNLYRREIILIITIIILGVMNVLLSDNMYMSLSAMRLFLLSGIIPLWTSMFLLADRTNKFIFYYFCSICLIVVAIGELFNYFYQSSFLFFIYNPIPLGTLIILLSVGPLNLSLSSSLKAKITGLILLSLGLFLIIITQKRGSILAVAAMSLAWIFYRYVKSFYFIVVVLLAIAFLMPLSRKIYHSLDQNIPSHFSILHRLELYPFSLHVYKKHPFFGIGLQSYSYQKYLKDYQQKDGEIINFAPNLKNLQKLENMFLTSFVELGAIMTLVYIGMILYIILKFCRNALPFSLSHDREFILLLPLFGLMIHSLTYDSLLWPQINWLFHVQLGVLAGYGKAN